MREWVGFQQGAVAEVGEVEVGAEVAVEAGEDVEVEGGGDALRRRRRRRAGCATDLVWAGREVGAEQEGVAGLELGAQVGEDGAGLGGGEVADAGADVEGEDAGVGGALEAEGSVM